MFVLDSMQDDIEDFSSIMTYLGEWRSYWPQDFTEDEVLHALASLVKDGLVEVYEESPKNPELIPVDDPHTDGATLRHYWFRPTPSGKRVWNEWDAPSLPE